VGCIDGLLELTEVVEATAAIVVTARELLGRAFTVDRATS